MHKPNFCWPILSAEKKSASFPVTCSHHFSGHVSTEPMLASCLTDFSPSIPIRGGQNYGLQAACGPHTVFVWPTDTLLIQQTPWFQCQRVSDLCIFLPFFQCKTTSLLTIFRFSFGYHFQFLFDWPIYQRSLLVKHFLALEQGSAWC